MVNPNERGEMEDEIAHGDTGVVAEVPPEERDDEDPQSYTFQQAADGPGHPDDLSDVPEDDEEFEVAA